MYYLNSDINIIKRVFKSKTFCYHITMTKITRKTSDFVLVNPNTININIDPKLVVKNKYYEPNKPCWLYVLKLEHKKYYVGFTGKSNPYDRIMEHVEGEGAKWTQLHKPVEVMEIRDAGKVTLTQIKALEQNLTWAYMTIYGTKNVRGGVFNYPGRILRIGDRIIMGYMFESFIAAFLVIILSVYILLLHYLNWR